MSNKAVEQDSAIAAARNGCFFCWAIAVDAPNVYDDEDDMDDDELIEYECPHCGTVIFFDGEAFDMEEEHLCPNCHRSVFEEDENEAQEDDEE